MIIALTVMFGNIAFFFVGGGLLHHLFYNRRSNQRHEWKYQPTKTQSLAESMKMVPLVLVNGLIINGAIGFAVAAVIEDSTRAYWSLGDHSILYTLLSTAGLFLWYHVMLYYWHRTMHRPWLFRRFHCVHHKHKAPIWLDALYEHPVEAAWGAVVLATPVFLFPVWAYSFFFFLFVMGLHELLDHAGIRLDLPLFFLSKSEGHDEHHRRSNVYYGQLLPLLDWFHKTNAPVRRRRKT